MAKKRRKKVAVVRADSYHAILAEVVQLLESARRASGRAINAVMTATYWRIGRRIVEYEQQGRKRALYGEQVLERLSSDLIDRFGRGFSARNLRSFRAFYLGWPIRQTASAELPDSKIRQTTSAESSSSGAGELTAANRAIESRETLEGIFRIPSDVFPLPWSHYVRLLSVENPLARKFYETEILRGGWTVKQLDRQIETQFYERTALSRNKVAMLTRHNRARAADAVTAEEELKDPYLLEFVDMKDEYSELELENALLSKLQVFLLELGNDFAFIGRQRRMRIGDTWHRVDLLLFHRRLDCLVIIDLKTGKFTAADAGQMHLYCNYAKEHWTNPDENPPVGLILCTDHDDATARYALDGLPNKIVAARYKTALPNEKLLAEQVEKARKVVEARQQMEALKRKAEARLAHA
jgi:predicted nuclease of restriction endonuclease-like (RecB) superfamily